jgi:hypothetical protein
MGSSNNDVGNGRWLSVAQAATELGLSERLIYRQIATQTVRARRDEEGALQVLLEDGLPHDKISPGLTLPLGEDEALTPSRARALTDFATGLMQPLVSRLAQQEKVIREQAEELGRLRARTELEADSRVGPALEHQLSELAAIREEVEHLGSRRRWWPFR